MTSNLIDVQITSLSVDLQAGFFTLYGFISLCGPQGIPSQNALPSASKELPEQIA